MPPSYCLRQIPTTVFFFGTLGENCNVSCFLEMTVPKKEKSSQESLRRLFLRAVRRQRGTAVVWPPGLLLVWSSLENMVLLGKP